MKNDWWRELQLAAPASAGVCAANFDLLFKRSATNARIRITSLPPKMTIPAIW
jgi:hypothetical protein